MTRVIAPQTPQEPEKTNSWKQQLDTKRHVIVYPRVSTPEQMKNVSAEMQQDKTFVLKYGWPDELIIMDTSDLGLSGQLRMEDRPALNRALRLIAEGTAKTVVAARVDRLFRDRWGKEYAKFMEICYTYSVKVVTLTVDRRAIDFVYDFSISSHVDQFRRECEAAWKYIERHIYMMAEAKNELGRRGLWFGANMPTGYIPDRREEIDGRENPDYRKIFPYWPHGEKIDWLYDKFMEMAGNVAGMCREVARLPYLFPPFEEHIDKEIVNRCPLTKVLDEDGKLIGYAIGSEKGLRDMLANPVYAGMWVHKGVLIRSDNHEAIVELGKFLYAFNRLSPTNLDGTPNEEYLERCKKYVKKHRSDQPALLRNCIFAKDDRYRVRVKDVPRHGSLAGSPARPFYAFVLKTMSGESRKYMLPAEDVDSFFLDILRERLLESDDFEHFLEEEEAVQTSRAQLLKDIDEQIQAVGSLMRKIEQQITSGLLTNPRLLQKADEEYNGLEEELQRLQARRKEVATTRTHAQKRRTYKQLMFDAGECWDEVVPPEEYPVMVDAFVEKVVLDNIAPRFYTMTIYWRDPAWGIDELVCFRAGNPSISWTAEEDELLGEHYPMATPQALLKMFPHRSPYGIKHRAVRLGLETEKPKPWGKMLGFSFSLQDYEIMERYGLTEDDLRDEAGAKLISTAKSGKMKQV